MKLILYFLIIFLAKIAKITLSSIMVLPFEVNQINFVNKKYNSTEIINLLFKAELYTPIKLGSENESYFGLISLDRHHPILSESSCEKMNLFQKNKNIIKKGYKISDSKTAVYLADIHNYLQEINSGEIYTEIFSYYNNTLIEQNNNIDKSEFLLIKDNLTKTTNPEMCLEIGLGESTPLYVVSGSTQFIDYLHYKHKIKTGDWTIKFTGNNNGLLIIGDLPHEYDNKTKYKKDNYTQTPTKNIASYFFRPWGIEMKEIYFYNSSNDPISVNLNSNKFSLVNNFGFIIGSNQYKELISKYFFNDLINKKICEIETSEKTIYNKNNTLIDTDGNYSVIFCDKVKFTNYQKKFPILFFSHIDYNYIFELTYKDLFIDINNYYLFMIIFPNNPVYNDSKIEEWYMGIPFLKKYQFVFNYDSKTVGFYNIKNIDDEDEEKGNKPNKGDGGDKSESKVWIYILQILLVIILIVVAVFIGMLLKRERKKRANELKDDNYEYIEGDTNKNILNY